MGVLDALVRLPPATRPPVRPSSPPLPRCDPWSTAIAQRTIAHSITQPSQSLACTPTPAPPSRTASTLPTLHPPPRPHNPVTPNPIPTPPPSLCPNAGRAHTRRHGKAEAPTGILPAASSGARATLRATLALYARATARSARCPSLSKLARPCSLTHSSDLSACGSSDHRVRVLWGWIRVRNSG